VPGRSGLRIGDARIALRRVFEGMPGYGHMHGIPVPPPDVAWTCRVTAARADRLGLVCRGSAYHAMGWLLEGDRHVLEIQLSPSELRVFALVADAVVLVDRIAW
jgi:hypothetical protein